MSKDNIRKSTFITKKKTQKIFNAFDYAKSIGKPLNYTIVLHLKDTIQQHSGTAFKRILAKFRDWLWNKPLDKNGNRKHIPFYVYTHENPKNNPHVNWCVHVPRELKQEFERKLIEWITKVQGEPKTNELSCQPTNMSCYKSIASYILKGTNPKTARDFFYHEKAYYDEKWYQGLIYGQRAGFSRSLGPTALRRTGFIRARHK